MSAQDPPRPDGFFSRWSRLKRGEVPDPTPDPAPPVVVADSAPVAQEADEPPFDLSQLPSLGDLTTESDLRPFLNKAVPEGLRNAALKRMWALDPAIRDFVGPVDYAWDFNTPGGLPGIAEAMTGDVGELLARAIGAFTESPAAIGPSVAPVATSDLPKAVATPPVGEKITEIQPEVAEFPSLRRRHGGALPA